MLEVGTWAAAFGHNSPVVIQGIHPFALQVYHRFYGYRHTGHQPHTAPRVAVVRHFGVLVHLTPYAVAHIFAHHAVAEALGIGLNGVADIPKMIAVYGLAHTLVKALLRDLDGGGPGVDRDPS
mgnify:CR=1 FL=1